MGKQTHLYIAAAKVLQEIVTKREGDKGEKYLP